MFMTRKFLSVLSILTAGLIPVQPAWADRAVAVNTAVIFEAPGLDQRRIGQLGTGEWVNVEFCENDWCFIRASQDRKGWAAWSLLAAPGQGWKGGTAIPGATPEPAGTQVFSGQESNAGSYQPPQNQKLTIFKILPLDSQ